MDRQKKVLRNFLIIAILVPLALYRSGSYLTPLSAHEHSERSIHYGPSQVVHIQDYEEGKYILCKYDKWISCNTVNRQWLFFWRFGNQVTGIENDLTKGVNYTWSSSYQYFKAYGIINDDRIKKIEIMLSDGTTLTQTDFYDDMFLLTWTTEKHSDKYMKSIRGYDSNNAVLYEDSVPGAH
jgi:hypothetical protein